ncbi:MAG: hypothetical protein HS122_03890 [Opitutaceae bacterium]|nr:hypothetical protein [Opitutaceae bacterium]
MKISFGRGITGSEGAGALRRRSGGDAGGPERTAVDAAAQQAAQQAWDRQLYSAATIEDWYYDYRHGVCRAAQSKAL